MAFAKETTLYVGRLGLPPMVNDLTIGINKGLHHAVSVLFSNLAAAIPVLHRWYDHPSHYS